MNRPRRSAKAVTPILLILTAALLAPSAAAAEGPALVRDLRPDGPSNPRSLTAAGSRVFFTADDGVKGRELYVSDGTFDGTKRVRDIWVGSGSANPTWLTALGERLFFIARDGVDGAGLYVSDGTAAGTKRLVKRRSCGSEAEELLVHGGLLYFAAYNNAELRCDLMSSDGTPAGTVVAVPGIDGFLEPTSFGSRIVWVSGFSPTNGELWKSDGTPAGTKKFKTVASGWINQLTVAGNLLFFADGGGEWPALWKSDGTKAGTKPIGGDSGPRSPSALTEFSGKLFFSAHRTSGGGLVDDGLWKSNGTAAGTKVVKHIGGGSGCVDPQELTEAGSLLFFFVCDVGTGETQLWKTNGSPAGTSLVGTFAGARFLDALGSYVYFDTGSLTRSNGTAAGTETFSGVINVANITSAHNAVFFTGSDPGFAHAGELFRYAP